MREKISRKILGAIEYRDAKLVRLLEVRILQGLAKRSFGMQGRSAGIITDSSLSDALRRYAEFTTACMEFNGSETDLPERLYQDAYRLGGIIRRITGFRERADLDRLIFCLYRNIDIDMSGSTDSELLVSDCYFSNYYTPEQCRLMSNVDSGIIAGICGGGRLEFTERITEGCGRCRACLADNGTDQDH